MPWQSWDEDVVDDSEPEREEQRRKRKAEKKKALTCIGRLDEKIIELDDNTSSCVQLRGMSKSPKRSISEISDEGVCSSIAGPMSKQMIELHAARSPNTGFTIDDKASGHSEDLSRTVSGVLYAQVPNGGSSLRDADPTFFDIKPLPQGTVEIDSESEDGGQPLNIAKFIYNTSRPSKASRIPAPSIVAARPLPKKTAIGHRFTNDFSDTELAKLVKCVCCDIRWTSRKSVSQKMVHVQSCAKRNSLTDETVRILMRKELNTTHPVDPKGKGKGTLRDALSPPEPAPPKTYLEDIINDAAAPKKKGKRPDVLKTVKCVTETRDIILHKARNVLGYNIQPMQTDVFGCSRLTDLQGPEDHVLQPSTQSFGQSVLAERPIIPVFRRPYLRPAIFDSQQSQNTEESPTQQFAPSKLATVLRRPSPTVESAHNVSMGSRDLSNINLTDSSVLRAESSAIIFTPYPCPELVNSSVNEPFRHPSKRNVPDVRPLLRASELDVGSSGFGNDHDYDVYKQCDHGQHLHFSSGDQGFGQDIHKCESPSASTDSEIFVAHATKGKNRNVRMDKHEETQIEWNEKITEIILHDDALHLRILRYEPVHYNLFVKLAEEHDLNSRGQDFKLRSLLDKLGINFYGTESAVRMR